MNATGSCRRSVPQELQAKAPQAELPLNSPRHAANQSSAIAVPAPEPNPALSESAFAGAYASGCSMTKRFLVRQGARFDLAEELAQAAWAKGWEYRGQLRDPRVVTSWVNSIALNMHRGVCRKPAQVPLEEVAASPNLDLSIDMQRALAALSGPERSRFERRYCEGYCVRDIAEREHTTEGAIRIRLMRTRRKIQHAMEAIREQDRAIQDNAGAGGHSCRRPPATAASATPTAPAKRGAGLPLVHRSAPPAAVRTIRFGEKYAR